MNKLRKLYKQGVNLCAYLRKEEGVSTNTPEIIKKSYDIQTGIELNQVKNGKLTNHITKYSELLSLEIKTHINPKSILEAGVGDGITLVEIAKYFKNTKLYGFDISPNRVKLAKKWLFENKIKRVKLKIGNLLDIPYPANSFDVVYTSHAMEPNGGSEEIILKELHRVAKKYIFLLEPGYEFAKKEYQRRMDSFCFVKGLKETAKKLGYKVIKHELFPLTANPKNPTAILIIKK